MANNGVRSTFLELYKNHGIFIPKIQRDYVQGRGTAQVQKNRASLLDKLVEVLENKDKRIMLNFVYGYQASEGFVPIDGQQRLTTLFLLHAYLYAKANQLDELDNGKNFRYDTRETTNRFFDALFEGENLKSLTEIGNVEAEAFVKEIEDCAWFSSSWKNDPSILSCMVMLGEIHKRLNGATIGVEILNRLADITFMSLDITQDVGKANQLYIRMNARGKQLTAFENFKADMYGYLNGKPIKKALVDNMDGNWLDMLWKLDEDVGKTYAEKYGDIFYRELLHWIILNAFTAEKGIFDKLTSLTQKGKNIEEIYFDEYKELDKDIIAAVLQDVYYALHVLYLLSETKGGSSYFKKIKKEFFRYLDEKNKYSTSIGSYPNRARLFAVTKFGRALDSAKSFDIEACFDVEKFDAWYRIMDNLITNAEIDNLEKFQKAIQAIANVDGDVVLDVSKIGRAKAELENISKSYIVEEEIFKQTIIDAFNTEWKDKILKAEQIPFFEGEIRFIFKALNIDENNANGKAAEFEEACKMIKTWVNEKDYTLLRLLYSHMSAADCFYNGERRFYVNQEPHRNYDVRGLLREDKGIKALQTMLADARGKGADVYANDCFAEPMKTVGDVYELFREYLIHKPCVISYCEQGRFYVRNDVKIYLVKGKNLQKMPEYTSYVEYMEKGGVKLNELPNTYVQTLTEHDYDYKRGHKKCIVKYDEVNQKYEEVQLP